MVQIESYFNEKRNVIENALGRYLGDEENPLRDLMEYSVLAGGKRFRPILMLAAVESLGHDPSIAIPAACAMEIVHCFSLVHDDLPCMDDDDYRRGRLSCHKRFSESQALLAGDALLALAFDVLTDKSGDSVPEAVIVKLIRELAESAGGKGMIGGQFLECLMQDSETTEESLNKVHRYKTGALIRGSLRMGAIIAGSTDRDLRTLTEYGEAIGMLFQIVDDILDAGTGNERISFSTYYGTEVAKRKAADVAEIARVALRNFSGTREIFEETVNFLLNRER